LGLKGNETSLNDATVKSTVISEIEKYTNLKKYDIENNKTWIESQEIRNNYFNFSSISLVNCAGGI
jgi:hypothetical protein